MGVGGCRIRIYLGEPGERHPVVQHLNAKVGDAQGFPYQISFGFQQLREVAHRHLVERNLHCKSHRFALWRAVGDFFRFFGFLPRGLLNAVLRLTFKASGGDGFQHPLDFLAVGAVVKEECPILGNRKVVDLIVAGGHELVFRPGASGISDDLYKFLALGTRHIVSDFHVRKPPLFW